MGRINACFCRLPHWVKPAAAASATLFAGLALFASPPKSDLPPVVVNRVALDERAVALDELGVTRWHKQGWRGQGVKVAVLDSGFRGYKTALGKFLPAKLTTKSFRNDGDLEARDSQHGILCAEIVHSLAPDAEILLANWEPDVPESFVRAMRWARDSGARVATCSVIMPSWSDGAGGGPTHAALRAIAGDGSGSRDLLFTAPAGNLAQRHWSGVLATNGDGQHQWSAGQHLNAITPWGNERVAVELYGSLSVACRLQVFERDTGRLVQEADLRPELAAGKSWGQTSVRFEPEPQREYDVAVRVLEGSSADEFHVAVLGGYLRTATQAGSIPFPGDGDQVVTLGCVDEQRRRLVYSSCGPNSQRPKPDFVAQVPFPSRFRNRPFTGTSAAAPQGAGLAALLMSRDTNQSPDGVRATLRKSAIDLLEPGHDAETGFGLLRLP